MQGRRVGENLCVKNIPSLQIVEIILNISCMNDTDKQKKLSLSVMNHNKFLMICILKYHLKFGCLVIYKPFYQATVYCNTRCYFLKAQILKYFQLCL